MYKLPVLMYHDVTAQDSDSCGLTIAVSRLEAQFEYLKEAGFTTLHFADLQQENSINGFPEKAIILTFDDVYANQFKLAYPLLKKYGLKACFYIPCAFVGKVDAWDDGKLPLMTLEQLKSLDPKFIELGLHSFSHESYDLMEAHEIQNDLEQCLAFQKRTNLKIHQTRTLAYPYGKYPRKSKQKKEFVQVLKENNIAYGLRIGNRVNRFPFKNNYEIQRLGIKGEDSLKTFKRKITKGRSWF